MFMEPHADELMVKNLNTGKRWVMRRISTENRMNKEQALKIMRLLSALEAAGLMNPNRLPDYLYDDISSAVELLERIILDAPQKAHNVELAGRGEPNT